MVYLTYLEYRRKRISKPALIFWMIVWIGGVILIIAHQQINTILPTLNIIRAMDLYMILAFMLLFAVIFYLFQIIKNTEKRLENPEEITSNGSGGVPLPVPAPRPVIP